MSSMQALLLVLDAAEKARDHAVSVLDDSRRGHEAALQQAQSLQTWRSEYQARWQGQFQQGGGMEIMRCYQDFMVRIGEAVSGQQQRVDQAHAQFERLRLELIERERRVAAVSQLIARRQAEVQHKLNRAEQKATDEDAARSARMTQSREADDLAQRETAH